MNTCIRSEVAYNNIPFEKPNKKRYFKYFPFNQITKGNNENFIFLVTLTLTKICVFSCFYCCKYIFRKCYITSEEQICHSESEINWVSEYLRKPSSNLEFRGIKLGSLKFSMLTFWHKITLDVSTSLIRLLRGKYVGAKKQIYSRIFGC